LLKNDSPDFRTSAKPSPPAPLPEGEGRFNPHFAEVQFETKHVLANVPSPSYVGHLHTSTQTVTTK